jgi:hypothetical protein
VSLQRYLWSRVAYEKEATFRILGGLLMNQLWLENKASTDREFHDKFKGVLKTSSSLLRELNLSQGFSETAARKFASRIRTELEGFLIPQRNYGQWKQRFDSSVVLSRQKPLGVNKKLLPPKRFIGIGYGDKGTAKKPELDGSQSWQEIAQSDRVLRKEHQEELKHAGDRTKTLQERIEHSRRALKILTELQKGDAN